MTQSSTRSAQWIQKMQKNLPLWCPIMGSHLLRLGPWRVAMGTLGMYLSIPVFMLVHAVVIKMLLRWIVHPVLGIEGPETGRFILLDRYRVKGLSFIDTFHCLFCGWANGLCTFLDHEVEMLSRYDRHLSMASRAALWATAIAYIGPALVIQGCFYLIYNHLIAAPLKLEKVYYGGFMQRYLRDTPFAAGKAAPVRYCLTYQKISWAALSQALLQIESAWCPIKHFESMNKAVYPDHHRLFFEPHQIDALREFLKHHPTVLERDIP